MNTDSKIAAIKIKQLKNYSYDVKIVTKTDIIINMKCKDDGTNKIGFALLLPLEWIQKNIWIKMKQQPFQQDFKSRAIVAFENMDDREVVVKQYLGDLLSSQSNEVISDLTIAERSLKLTSGFI